MDYNENSSSPIVLRLQGPYSWVGHNTLWTVLTPMIEHTAITSYSWARKLCLISLGPSQLYDQTHPGITRVLAVSPRNHNDYHIPVAIIHRHYLFDICCSMYCTLILWVPSALLKVFTTSLLLFQCWTDCYANKLYYRNALRFAINRIVTSPVFNNTHV